MRSTRAVGAGLLLAFAALLSPDQAAGQYYEPGQWRVNTVFGVSSYDGAAGLKTTGFVGGEVHYSFTRNISLGGTINFSRPEVNGAYFPLALFKIAADTSILYEAGYQATQSTYNVLATLGTPVMERGYVYALGGVGGYTIWTSPSSVRDIAELNDRRAVTHMMIPVGLGVAYAVSDAVGVRISARDDIFLKGDALRGELNPVEPRFQNTCAVENFCILEANRNPPEPKSTLHNFRFSIGFEFTPGR